LTNNKLIQNLREPKQYLKAVLTKKLISYIRKGKITFAHSLEKMSEKVQLKGSISELNFGYNAKMGGCTNLRSDITKLYDILLGAQKIFIRLR
jgi:hypothetical protein